MSENMGSGKRRKVLSATLAIAMVATMLLSGTLAYFYSADATNIIKGTQKEVIGHDDLFKESGSLYNKDVYAENTGNSRAFVRIRLTESLSLDGTEVVPEAAKVIHTIVQEEKDGAKVNVDKHIVKDETGDAYVDYTATDPIHENFAWTMGGTGKSFLSKASGDYPQVATNGVRTYYLTTNGVAHDNRKAITEEQVQKAPEKYGEAPACAVITMTAYKAMVKETSASGRDERLSYCGWVVDTDGWAYWSQPLRPGEATGLLLNQVEIKNPKAFGNREFEYKINVEYQAVDDEDIGIWLGDKENDEEGTDRSAVEEASADARTMLKYLQKKNEYPAESIEMLNEIYAAMGKLSADQAPVKKLYEYALSHAEGAVYDSPYGNTEQVSRAAEAKAAAEALEAAIAAKPEILTNPCDLSGIDEKIKAYIVATYGKNDALTEAQAASVSMIAASDVTSIDGVTNERFPNLKRLALKDPKMDSIQLPEKLNKLREFVVNGTDTKQVRSIDFTASQATIEDLLIIAPGLQSLNATVDKPGINIEGTAKWVYFGYRGAAPEPEKFNLQPAIHLRTFDLQCLKLENDTVVEDWDADLLNGGLTLNCPKLTNFTLTGGFTAADAAPVVDLSACSLLQAVKMNQNGLAVTCKVSDQAPVRTDLSVGIKVVPIAAAPPEGE